ncbi:hypothetical protein HDV00_008245 [Rhizophlyctis rosea]|nr:hypothetical protein HDV00_008245 [Rhizophlyctis rosea]
MLKRHLKKIVAHNYYLYDPVHSKASHLKAVRLQPYQELISQIRDFLLYLYDKGCREVAPLIKALDAFQEWGQLKRRARRKSSKLFKALISQDADFEFEPSVLGQMDSLTAWGLHEEKQKRDPRINSHTSMIAAIRKCNEIVIRSYAIWIGQETLVNGRKYKLAPRHKMLEDEIPA